MDHQKDLSEFLSGKTEFTLSLFRFFIDSFSVIGTVNLRATKTMIALEGNNRFAYVTQLGKNFIQVVFSFNQPFEDNLCFIKIAQVPGTNQYNHHLRIYDYGDINEEVKSFMKMAYHGTN